MTLRDVLLEILAKWVCRAFHDGEAVDHFVKIVVKKVLLTTVFRMVVVEG